MQVENASKNIIELFQEENNSISAWHQIRRQISSQSGGVKQIKTVTQSLKDKRNSLDRLRYGISLWMQGKHKEAAYQLEKLVDDAQVGEQAKYFLALSLFQLDEQTQALTYIRELSYLDEPWVKFAEAEMLLETNDVLSAQNILSELKNYENNAQYNYLWGYCKDLQGLTSEAIDYYEKALQIDSLHSGALFRLAYIADLHGNDDLALEYYERLLDITPVHYNALVNLGILYEDMDKFEKAHECFEAALAQNPTDMRVQLYLKDIKNSFEMYYDEEKEKEEDKRLAILRTPITDFELTVRSRNCLTRMNIRTLSDLVTKTEQELLSFKNFGETSLQEIKQVLSSKGLTLGMSPDAKQISKPEDKLSKKEKEKLMAKSISELNFSVRIRKVLERKNIRTIGELIKHKESDFTVAKNFGKHSMAELKQKLAELGLSLADD